MFNASKSAWNPKSIWKMNPRCCSFFTGERTTDLPQSMFVFNEHSTFGNMHVEAFAEGTAPINSGFKAIDGMFSGGSRVR